jgi:type IV pilus assembly protein PilM
MADVVGLDIGSYAIKAAWGKRSMGGATINLVGSTYNPTGQFLPGDESAKEKLAVAIRQLFVEQKITVKDVHVCLPESMAYTSVISMPYLSDAELASSIHWEAEQHIPVPLDEVNLEYEVLFKPNKADEGEKMRVLLVAAKKDAINQLVSLLHAAGLEIAGLETSLLASHRALLPAFMKSGTVMVVHIGALSTDLMVVHQGEPVLTYTVPTGGLALTRSLEKQLGLQPQQAEEYKRAYGLDPTQLEGKVRQTLSPVVNVMVAEMRKALQYFQTSHQMANVQTMLLSGGSAYLPGLPTFLAEAFSYEVLIANPLEGVSVKQSGSIPETVAAFVPVLGLAQRSE